MTGSAARGPAPTALSLATAVSLAAVAGLVQKIQFLGEVSLHLVRQPFVRKLGEQGIHHTDHQGDRVDIPRRRFSETLMLDLHFAGAQKQADKGVRHVNYYVAPYGCRPSLVSVKSLGTTETRCNYHSATTPNSADVWYSAGIAG